jgi:hypothetical protein
MRWGENGAWNADYTDVRKPARLKRLGRVLLCSEQSELPNPATLDWLPSTEKNLMTTDSRTDDAAKSSDEDVFLSDQDAKLIARYEGALELADFVAALNMQRPVTSNQAARLLEHMIKETMSATIALIEGQMRTDHWEKDLSQGETLELLAERAQLFLETPAGVQLFNFFAKTFARTTGEMFH